MTSPLRQTPKGNLLHIRASPKSGRNEIVGVVETAKDRFALVVKVTAIPDKGQANDAVIKTLAKTIGIAPSSLRLVSGQTSKDKVFEVVNNLAAVQKFLANNFALNEP